MHRVPREPRGRAITHAFGVSGKASREKQYLSSILRIHTMNSHLRGGASQPRKWHMQSTGDNLACKTSSSASIARPSSHVAGRREAMGKAGEKTRSLSATLRCYNFIRRELLRVVT